MLFSLQVDNGDQVKGYFVPDSFSQIPNLRLMIDGEERLVFAASETRQALVDAGRHESGQCGFTIDAHMVPSLKDISNLELYDADTGLLIYRRPPPRAINKKVLRLETHLFPLWNLDRALIPLFQYAVKGIENYGRETISQMFLLKKIKSIYLSGRILYRSHAAYIESGFETLILMQDPYEELAERLLVLSKIRKLPDAALGFRDILGMTDVSDFAEMLIGDESHISDEGALRRLWQKIPADVEATLSNPVVRQFTSSTPDDMPGRTAIAAALDLLSAAAIVGVRRDSACFVEMVADHLKVKPKLLPPIPQFDKVPLLAQSLRQIREVEVILEQDLELYRNVAEVFDKTNEAAVERPALQVG